MSLLVNILHQVLEIEFPIDKVVFFVQSKVEIDQLDCSSDTSPWKIFQEKPNDSQKE